MLSAKCAFVVAAVMKALIVVCVLLALTESVHAANKPYITGRPSQVFWKRQHELMAEHGHLDMDAQGYIEDGYSIGSSDDGANSFNPYQSWLTCAVPSCATCAKSSSWTCSVCYAGYQLQSGVCVPAAGLCVRVT